MMTSIEHSPAAVRMVGIKKSYGGIHALKGVDLTVRAGSVHALIGENGAGKSTLLKILQGVVAPSEGEITVFGTPMTVATPEAARALGVGMIFQELSLVPALSVSENIFLNREPRWAGIFIDDRAARREARRLLSELGLDIDPSTPVAQLSIGEAQMTEIAKAMSQNARVLIMDEPTSALSAQEVEHLFGFLRKVTAAGVAVIYVSHRMDEIMEVADEVTILRDGRNVISAPLSELTLDAIVEHMVGKRVHNFTFMPRAVDRRREPILEVRHLTGKKKPVDVSFNLYPGEILGITGLMGSGRTELARTLFGIDPAESGEIKVKGRAVAIRSPQDAIRTGLVLIPESRQFEGLIVEQSVGSNLSLPQIDRLVRGPLIDYRRETAMTLDLIRQLRVKTESASTIVRTLSGGNQQKIVIAKWLATDPEIVIFDEPTAGVDIGSKSEIVDLIRSFADSGKGVVIISSEPAELLAVSDRILIMSGGRVARTVERPEIDSWSIPRSGTDPESSGYIAQSEHGLQVAIQKAHVHVH